MKLLKILESIGYYTALYFAAMLWTCAILIAILMKPFYALYKLITKGDFR
jgi:hypothetical protein